MPKSGTPVPDRHNDISCSWSEKEQRYISLAEKWRKMHMSWEDLLLLLNDMKTRDHTAFKDKMRVTAIIGGEEFYLDLLESLTTGKVYLVSDFNEEDGEGDDD